MGVVNAPPFGRGGLLLTSLASLIYQASVRLMTARKEVSRLTIRG